jgi:Endonuclease-reverse transcriptase
MPTEKRTQKIVVVTAYFPSEDKNPPPPELADLINYCNRHNIQILIGCDANAHHKQWGSSDTIENGECLLEFSMTNKLEIINRGKRPTYRYEGLDREEVIDLTLSSSLLKSRIKDWHVSDESSLSDHRHICFNMDADRTTQVSETHLKYKKDLNEWTEQKNKDHFSDLPSDSYRILNPIKPNTRVIIKIYYDFHAKYS